MSSSIYSTLPDTLDTSFAREMTEVLSEVKRKISLSQCVELAESKTHRYSHDFKKYFIRFQQNQC